MRKRWSPIVLSLVLGLGTGARPVLAENTDIVGDLHRSYLFGPTGTTMPYRLFVPKSYSPAKPSPLIVVLHGGGGDENRAFDQSNLKQLAEERGYMLLAVLGYTPYGGFGDIYPIVVGKSGAAASGGFRAASLAGGRPPPPPEPVSVPNPAAVDDYVEQLASELIDPKAGALSEQETLAALDDVKRSFSIDPHRIYLMGNSMGGVGTLYLAAKYPDLWAAVSPSDGPIAAWSYPYFRLRDAHLPVLFVHGAADEKSNPHWTELFPIRLVHTGAQWPAARASWERSAVRIRQHRPMCQRDGWRPGSAGSGRKDERCLDQLRANGKP